MRWIVLLCRLIVGGVFLAASIDKFLHPREFAEAIHHYRMVPYVFLHPMAMTLPLLEMVAGVAMILGVARRGAALITAGLTLVFIVAIASALFRGLDISCGCFNTDGGHGVGLDLLFRDFGLLFLCLPPLFNRDGGPELSSLLKK